MSRVLPSDELAWPITYAAVCLIAKAEGCRLKAYRCPAGVLTCGWGETDGVNGSTVWTQEHADMRLLDTLASKTAAVLAMCKVDPTANQLGALVSLAYNIGNAGLSKSSVLRAHNRGDFASAARAFGLWNKATVKGVLQVLPGLTNRRAAEAALYLEPDDDAPIEMPQAVAAESKMTQSPMSRTGAVTAGAGALAIVSEFKGTAGTVGETLKETKTIAVETLGIPADIFLPLVMVMAGAAVMWWRHKQRKDGWA